MKRGKPQQELYRPGSGPLRKSNINDESDPDSISSSKSSSYHQPLLEDNHHHTNRKSRKPEQPIYIPRPMQNQPNAREMSQDAQTNGNFEPYRSKRYSQRRRPQDDYYDNRSLRQGSEPRSLQPPNNRTYEKSYNNKPPSGRRHSIDSAERKPAHKPINVDKLPPRFRKKILEESQGIIQANDDNWNGASLTFQGTSNFRPISGYNTLPHGQRGRGRLMPEYGAQNRSRTPDFGAQSRGQSPCGNMRPPTPSHGRTRSNDNSSPPRTRNYEGRRPNTHGRRNNDQYYQQQQQRVKVHEEENWTDEPKYSNKNENENITHNEGGAATTLSSNNQILDWSEEVELSEKLEAGGLSDALTRSSSIASLVDKNQSRQRSEKRRSKRRSSRRNRESSLEKPGHFKTPLPVEGRGRRDRRDSSFERRNPSRESSREPENWRDEIRSRQNSERESDRSRRNSEQKDDFNRNTTAGNGKKPGVLVLPKQTTDEQPRFPEVSRKNQQHQKSLFDHNNPGKPIIVKSPGSRVSVPGFSDNAEQAPPQLHYTTDQYGNLRPGWYDEGSDTFKSCRYQQLISEIKSAAVELEMIMNSGSILINWGTVEKLRNFLKEALQYLLCRDLKFCQSANVEQHLWKTLYHNIIEVTRKAIINDPNNKEQYKGFLLFIIDEGTKYFESLLDILEETYKFKLNNFLLGNGTSHSKGSGFVGLALISAQKVLLFLGDLGRYREQVNETSNYGKCRQWYIKAHEINPKNGKPYNQLALLAVLSRRKLDAVYYYMRSLMSSNPVHSARESVISLFEEIRKKYEQGEKKRREERLERAKQHMKQKESENAENAHGHLRHETWIRPNGGRRVHRTTQALKEEKDSEEEDLAALSSVEVNKRFVISYLHVHGKLITKIGMESFQEAAMQMLKEFRALLQHSPVPLPCNRFLQLLALNMFAIESTQLKDPKLQQQTGYRSELQERALVVSLQMFNLILERCVELFQESSSSSSEDMSSISPDVHVLLPAVKIWCDWMLCHSSIWNPPPSTQDFRVGSPVDAWNRLARLMNLLDRFEENRTAAMLADKPRETYEQIRLPEDSVLCGFTPLMVNEPDVIFAPNDFDVEVAQFMLRIKKLMFFGTVFLCGLEPPVLKLEIEDDFREYVSVVSTSNSRDSPVNSSPVRNDVLLESFSDDDDKDNDDGGGDNDDDDDENEAFYDSISDEVTTKEVRDLLHRKVELERTQRRQELHKQRVKKILSQNVVSVHIQVRPKYLVPDTNCFIDHLDRITGILGTHVYTLMVPIVVMSELEGLSRGGKSPTPTGRSALNPQHIQKVASAAKKALAFLKSKPTAVKCVTTKGAVLSSTTFTTEDDSAMDSSIKNDDKILATCLVLSKGHKEQGEQEGEIKKLLSEVVLLTDDRNLRVKAHARNVPVREMVDFMQWAGLG